MATAGSGARVNPGKMPGQQWVYAVFALFGGFFSLTLFWLAVPEVARLWSLGGLPPFAGVPLTGGAIYHGSLEGPTETTPLGHPAVAWIGVVTQTIRHGKGTYTAEKCRLGHLSDLHLAGDGARWEIGTLDLRDVELKLGFSAARSSRTRYWLGPTETASPVPDAIVARCRIDRDDLAHGEWTYAEQAASRGSSAEFAGCAAGDVLRSCGRADGVAAGHLSTAGMRAMARRMSDGLIEMTALLVLLMTFFAAVGAVSAVLALRAAAPIEVVHPEQSP